MAKKKSKTAAAAAAAATAAVAAIEKENGSAGVRLSWNDDADDNELREEVLAGLQQIDEDAPGEILWELYCDLPIDKKGQIRKLTTAELPGLRDECLGYGPGDYHIVARHKEGELNGTFVTGSRKTIKISGFARPTTVIPTSAAAAVDPQALFQQWEAREAARRDRQRAEREATLKFWAPILAPLGLKLAEGLFGRGESVKDLVAALVGMKDLVGAGAKTDGQVDALLKGIELAKDLNPPGSTGSTWPDVIAGGLRELRPVAEGLLAQRRNAPAAPAGTPQLQFAPAQPAPAGAAAPNTTTAAAGSDPMWTVIEPLLRRLAGELEEYAVNGTDPGLVAEALLAKIPRLIRSQVQPQQLKEWLLQPNWWELTEKFAPSLRPHQGFCDNVRQVILQIVEEEINPPKPDDEEQE